jgi:ribosomal-protein-serine acetyltransferase
MRLEVADGCYLRLLEEPDAEELYELVDANRDHLAEWMPWAAGQTLEQTANFIRASLQRHADRNGSELALMLGDRMVGAAGFAGIDWVARSTSVGYWLAEQHQGNGLMTRAVRALVDHAFGELELHRVEIQAAEGNRRSRAIPERLGFEQEGILREAECVGGRYMDLVVYGLLVGDQAESSRSSDSELMQ